MIGEEEHVGLEMALSFDLVGLGRDIALLDRVLVEDERGGIEIIGPTFSSLNPWASLSQA